MIATGIATRGSQSLRMSLNESIVEDAAFE
jgi:hypothetical protein